MSTRAPARRAAGTWAGHEAGEPRAVGAALRRCSFICRCAFSPLQGRKNHGGSSHGVGQAPAEPSCPVLGTRQRQRGAGARTMPHGAGGSLAGPCTAPLWPFFFFSFSSIFFFFQ